MIPSDIRRLFHQSKRWLMDGIILQGRRYKFPDKIIIETTNICSLRCSCCPNGNNVAARPKGMMDGDTFNRVLENIDLPIKECFLHLCGEPFLNPRLADFCRVLLDKKIIPVIFSNGYGIDDDLLRALLTLNGPKISFSMEINSKENYERLRCPGSYKKALESIDRINKAFSEARRLFGLNIILTGRGCVQDLEQTIRDLFAGYNALGVVTFSSEWPWPDLSSTGNLAGHLSSRRSFCSQAKELPAVLWDGRVTFCNLDYKGEMIIGSILDQPLSKLINNKEARGFRRRLAMNNLEKDSMCANCVVPRFNTFTINVPRKMLSPKYQDELSKLISQADDYFREGY